jgi:uncharacterized cupredoxin-like copper-binding protein
MDHDVAADGVIDFVEVEPGGTGDLAHSFGPEPDLVIGCHERGHYRAGMKLRIDLTRS